ncbi:MAG: hypothetical protein ACKO7U_04715 [Actinomycetota bacterium]
MGKGYAEGPAVEAAEEARERLAEGPAPRAVPKRRAVLGCTPDDPSPHVLGWADEVDQEALFATGAAWGLRVVVIDDPTG